MTSITLLAALLVMTSIGQFALFIVGMKQLDRRNKEREQMWTEERRDLLDRIQAPSFDAYAGKVLREKKLEQPPEEKNKPPEFVS